MSLVKYYPMSIVGADKFSCPRKCRILFSFFFSKSHLIISVWIVSFGNADWKGILKSVSKRDYLRYISYMAEKSFAQMRKNSLKTETPVTYQTFIIDMEGLSMRQMAYKPCNKLDFIFLIFNSNSHHSIYSQRCRI